MRIAHALVAAVLPCFVACVVEPGPPAQPPAAGSPSLVAPPPPLHPPVPSPPTGRTSAPVADAGAVDASVVDSAAVDASSGDASVPTADGGAPDKLRACSVDSDCVAVDKVACCKNGAKEAVATSQVAAYAQSFKCPEPRPICAMHVVLDPRVAECDNAAHECTMVAPQDIRCGGFILNRHACPGGLKCQMKNPDVAGSCVPASPSAGH